MTAGVVPAQKGASPLIAGVFGKRKRFGSKTVVMTFQVPFARGSVVHSRVHIAQKEAFARTEAIAGMHRLALNTIVEATR